MRVERPEARAFYEREAAACGWSKAQRERPIGLLYDERLLASRIASPGLVDGDRFESGAHARWF